MTERQKRYFLKIPDVIQAQIDALGGKEFGLCTVRRITRADLATGQFRHLGIETAADGSLQHPEECLPDKTAGTWARRNRSEGYTIVYRDLPKTTKTWTRETPNYGDWSKGSHEIRWTREVNEKKIIPAHGWGIKLTRLEESSDFVTMAFELNWTFSKENLDKDLLLFALNVLQESAGGTPSVREPTTSLRDIISTLKVSWEILPHGELSEILRLLRKKLNPDPDEIRTIEERFRVLKGLRPDHFIAGTSGFARYFGAKFGANLVIFENIRYGNAAYVMFDDWEKLSRLSRTELLVSEENYIRVIHSKGWEGKLRDIVRKKRPRRE